MRKASKNRTDDDVVSSTNGSVMNEDQTETERRNDNSNLSDTDADSSVAKDDDSTAKTKSTPKKGKPSKSKGRKKKSEKETKATEESEEEYEVEKVVDSKKIKGKLHYLIRWKGYSADSDTWEPDNTLSCPELINKYNDEKDNAKNKDESPKSKGKKRKSSKKVSKSPSKQPKSEWDSKSADANAEYEVDRILEVHHKKTGKREFLIHWKGWSSKFDSWEPENNLNCPDLIKKFMDKVTSAKSTDSRSLRVNPESTNRFTLQDPSSGRRLSKRGGQRQRVRYDDMTE